MEFVHALNTPLVSAVLLTVGLLGLLLEMQTLHGIAGLLGLGALGVFFASHSVGPLVIILAIIGIAGILWELHVVPGHGAPGVLGGVMLLLSVLLAFGTPMIFVAMQTVASAIVLTVILFYVATRIFPENAWIRKLTFAGAQGADYVTSSDFSSLLGKSGIAATFLRPSGLALIDGQRADVLTQGEFIQEGTPVRVTRVEGSRIFVEPISLPSYKE